ncbi:MAG: hypothetical protein PHD20_04760 [Clostridia bacterium]|nr:hypothetical protein [Clostridia bacterium]
METIDILYGTAFTLNCISAYLHLCCDGDPKMGLLNIAIIVVLLMEIA